MFRSDMVDAVPVKEPPSTDARCESGESDNSFQRHRIDAKAAQHFSARRTRFLIGCDDQNRWVAVEIHGLRGGYFSDREAALKFAHEETGWREDAIRFVPRLSPFQMGT